MKRLKPGAAGAFAAADARHERRVAEQAAAEHERGKRWIAFDRFPDAALTDQIAVIADRHGAVRQRGGEGVLADAALVEVLPHARMNGQLRNGIAAVNLEQRLIKIGRLTVKQEGTFRDIHLDWNEECTTTITREDMEQYD